MGVESCQFYNCFVYNQREGQVYSVTAALLSTETWGMFQKAARNLPGPQIKSLFKITGATFIEGICLRLGHWSPQISTHKSGTNWLPNFQLMFIFWVIKQFQKIKGEVLSQKISSLKTSHLLPRGEMLRAALMFCLQDLGIAQKWAEAQERLEKSSELQNQSRISSRNNIPPKGLERKTENPLLIWPTAGVGHFSTSRNWLRNE